MLSKDDWRDLLERKVRCLGVPLPKKDANYITRLLNKWLGLLLPKMSPVVRRPSAVWLLRAADKQCLLHKLLGVVQDRSRDMTMSFNMAWNTGCEPPGTTLQPQTSGQFVACVPLGQVAGELGLSTDARGAALGGGASDGRSEEGRRCEWKGGAAGAASSSHPNSQSVVTVTKCRKRKALDE